ncbi:hypothetical protein [Streptomyces anatolicus]|nr:hypothetical protein [Streptomyces anatolicus]
MKKLTMALGTTLSGIGLVAGLQTTAQAAAPAAATTVPSCVSYEQRFVPFSPYTHYDVTNGCSTTVSVRMQFSNGGYDTCNTIPAGGKIELKYWAFAFPGLKGIASC